MKRIFLLGIAAALTAVSMGASAQSRALGSNFVRGTCLQVTGSGATIAQCNGGPNQVVDFSGYGHIRINGQCLDTMSPDNRQAQDKPLVLRACNNNAPSQKWAHNGVTGRLNNEQGFCADVFQEVAKVGQPVHAYPCGDGKRNQVWSFVNAAPPPQVQAPQAQGPRPTIDLRSLVAVSTGPNYDVYTADRSTKVGVMDAGGNITVSLPANIVAAGGGNVTLPNGQTIPIVAAGGGNIVAAGGGNIVAAGGGNIVESGGSARIVAAGGGNIVAAGGGNIVAAGGGNIVAAGGGNVAINPGMAGASVIAAGIAGDPPVKVEGGPRQLLGTQTVSQLRTRQIAFAQPAVATAQPAPAAPQAQGGSGRAIKSQHSGKCLDVPGGRYAAGNELAQADCNNQASQRFEFTSNGEIKIGGFCVDAYGGSGNAGDRIGLWQCTGAANQKWRVDAGQLKGINNRCIDLVQGSSANGAKYVLWDCHGGPNQKFGS